MSGLAHLWTGHAVRWAAAASVGAGLLWAATPAQAQAKRARHSGLHASEASATSGEGNLNLRLSGRTFLWDNQAAQRIPPLLPTGELTYGWFDFLDVAGGVNAVSYVLQPGYAYAKVKATLPAKEALRMFGISQSLEFRRQLLDFFPSNGFREKSEGFGPEGFLFGNGAPITSYRFTAAFDLEAIQISSALPFKLYANLGWEGAPSGYIDAANAEEARRNGVRAPDQSFAKIPMSAGLELKTFATDYFAEIQAEPFQSQVTALLTGGAGRSWTRYRVVGKTFDLHWQEAPAYAHAGARLKYANGLELMGGFSWLLSADRGPELGPCRAASNPCRDGATDGYSPFFPQWKVFFEAQYPLRFRQTAGELYRGFLLRRFGDRRKRVDLEKTLDAPGEMDAESETRRKRLEERRKEADAQTLDLD